jgi:hypothetical protein
MAQSYIVFDVPNATLTVGEDINNRGDVIAEFANASGQVHSFVRDRNGNLTIFDAPGADSTYSGSINNGGDVTGTFLQPLIGYRGFVRDQDGHFSVFDAPNSEATYANSLNDGGDVTGFYQHHAAFSASTDLWLPGGFPIKGLPAPSGVSLPVTEGGFVRDRSGNITVFDPPSGKDTDGRGINNRGDVTGDFFDMSQSKVRGFIRDRSGNFIVFDAPNATFTVSESINQQGDVTGYFFAAGQPNGYHSFIRDRNGNFNVFDAPNAVSTGAISINDAGEIAGQFFNTNQPPTQHSFVRDRNGNITVFDVPNAIETHALAINSRGDITGHFFDAAGIHGFVRLAPVERDTIPPVTIATPLPVPNSNGWNNTDMTITLNSADDEPGGTGVKQIQFSLAGAQTSGPEIMPGNIALVGVSAEGITTLTYFATDNAENVEESKSLSLKIDKTPPIISGMPSPGCSLWPPNHNFVQVGTVTATDALSGLAPGSLNVTGTSNEPSDPSDPDIRITAGAAGGFVVQLRAERLGDVNGRTYTLTATTKDVADNITTATAICTVPHDQSAQ